MSIFKNNKQTKLTTTLIQDLNWMAVLEEASFLYRSQTAQKASVRAVRPLGLYSPDLATWWLLRAVERPRRTDWTF